MQMKDMKVHIIKYLHINFITEKSFLGFTLQIIVLSFTRFFIYCTVNHVSSNVIIKYNNIYNFLYTFSWTIYNSPIQSFHIGKICCYEKVKQKNFSCVLVDFYNKNSFAGSKICSFRGDVTYITNFKSNF